MTPLSQAIVERPNPRKSRILLVAQAMLPESQFRAFRQVLLDELGKGGFEKELEKVIAEKQRKER